MKISRAYEKGAATLIVSMLLLCITAISIFYLNRNIIVEQVASSNIVRSTAAHEAAEAGLEWAIGMLNNPQLIDATCTVSTTGAATFRQQYVQTNHLTDLNINVLAGAAPGCFINGTSSTCSCPTTGTTAALSPSDYYPAFTVSFTKIDDNSVQVTSVGCNAIKSNPCTSATASNSDATATVKVILKLQPALHAAPASSLTCGGSCTLDGSFSVINTNPSINGITINAGGSITTTGGASVTSISGMPVENSQVGNDSTLSSLASGGTCSNSKVFQAYFGTSISNYASSGQVMSIDCTSANACGTAVNAAYTAGWRSFYFPSGFYWNNSAGATLGSELDPVTIVTPSTIDINGNSTIYGLLFSNDSNFHDLGTGGSTINGALVSCSDFNSNGNGQIVYDSAALSNLGNNGAAAMIRVPGSWRDF
jgi:hypothetical protein